MKKLNYYSTLILLLAVGMSFSGCEEETLATVFGSMTGSIVGTETTSWKASTRLAQVNRTDKQIIIGGTSNIVTDLTTDFNSDESIFIITEGAAETTYNRAKATEEGEDDKTECKIIYKKTGSATPSEGLEHGEGYYFATVAMVTIKKIDSNATKITGTFNGTLTGLQDGKEVTIKIEGGTFTNVLYNQ